MATENDPAEVTRARLALQHQKKLQEKNTEKQKAFDDWKKNPYSGKPTAEEFKEMNGKILTEKEIAEQSRATAEDKMEQQRKLDKLPLQAKEDNSKKTDQTPKEQQRQLMKERIKQQREQSNGRKRGR